MGMSTSALKIAIESAGSQSELGRLLGVSRSFIYQMAIGMKPVPAELCPKIERATHGAVRCEDLRPDVDWVVLRNSDCKHQEVA
jgi:DNA-binding transcriptional regulator YdaS (Cro superfamily)